MNKLELMEKRSNLQEELSGIIAKGEAEKRELNEGETSRMAEIKAEMDSLDEEIRKVSEKEINVLIVEKANIKRSGCLAAGVNAINAYITKGRVPQDYVDYCKKDADGIVREDLLLSMSERLNHVTKVMEDLGLVILKDENGDYVTRGNRNIKINGENIKPILADGPCGLQ